MLEAAPVKARVMPAMLCQAGSTTTVSPDSRTPFKLEVVPVPCASTVSAAATGSTGVAVGVGVRVGVFVGVGEDVTVLVGVEVDVVVRVGVGVLVAVPVGV